MNFVIGLLIIGAIFLLFIYLFYALGVSANKNLDTVDTDDFWAAQIELRDQQLKIKLKKRYIPENRRITRRIHGNSL